MKHLLIFVFALILWVAATERCTAQKPRHQYCSMGGQKWMIPDLRHFQFQAQDTVQRAALVFVKRERVAQFVPRGWSLPTLSDVKNLLQTLEGTPNSTGGKTVDSSYLKKLLPFELNGIYFTSAKRVIGYRSMCAFYTATDTLWQFRGGAPVQAQVALHLYRQDQGKINIEPTYAELQKASIYANLLFIKRKRQKSSERAN